MPGYPQLTDALGRQFALHLMRPYYRTCRELLAELAPDHLYLGSRVNNWFGRQFKDPDFWRAMAGQVDVVLV